MIAGMGFYTAKRIMEEAGCRLDAFREIIIEVNRDIVPLRQWISDHSYTCTKEKLIHDRGYAYIAIAFHTGKGKPLSDEEILTGTSFLDKECEEYIAYCQNEIHKIEKILSVCSKEDERIPSLQYKKDLFQKQIKMLQK